MKWKFLIEILILIEKLSLAEIQVLLLHESVKSNSRFLIILLFVYLTSKVIRLKTQR